MIRRLQCRAAPWVGHHDLRSTDRRGPWARLRGAAPGPDVRGLVVAGSTLRDQVAAILEGDATCVEPIGSLSVVGLLAKPIIDLAVARSEHQNLARGPQQARNRRMDYRGDAGNDGGQVFVLVARPWHRIAHLHVVDHGGAQWRDYLRLRDLLRRSSDARRKYEIVKLRLIEEFGDDRNAYTDGASDVVRSLVSELE